MGFRKILLRLGVCVLLIGCNPDDVPEASGVGQQASETVRQVQVVRTERGRLRATRSASATVEPAQESRVSAGASGRVAQVLKRPGQLVDAGETVLVLDDAALSAQLENARLAREAARINLEKARRASGESVTQLEAARQSAQANADALRAQLEEARAVLDAGGVAPSEVRTLEAQLAQAEAARVQAEDALTRAGRAGSEDLALLEVQLAQAENQVGQLETSLAETRVSAPFAGEIGDVFVQVGEFLAAGAPAFRLVSRENQQASFSVPPADARLLQEQGTVYLSYGGLDYAAQIKGASTLSSEQRLVTLNAELYPSEARVPNGAVAQLRYELDVAEGLLLPSSALSAEGGSNYVFVVEDGMAKRREVRVVAESGAQAAVEGLEPGAFVIAPRPLDVREGVKVSVLP